MLEVKLYPLIFVIIFIILKKDISIDEVNLISSIELLRHPLLNLKNEIMDASSKYLLVLSDGGGGTRQCI